MNKIIVSAMLLAMSATAAEAGDSPRPYVGLELSSMSVKFEDSEDNDGFKNDFIAFSLKLGAKSDRHGGELFFKNSTKEKEVVEFVGGDMGYTELSYAGYGVAGHYYMPIENKLSGRLGVNLGNYKATAKIHDYDTGLEVSMEDDWTIGYGIDAGLVYAAGERADIEGGLRLVQFSDKNFSLKRMTEMYVGARLVF